MSLGADSHHLFVADLAIRTGIAPSLLLQETDRMLWTMSMILRNG